jgi:hypothetical protein
MSLLFKRRQTRGQGYNLRNLDVIILLVTIFAVSYGHSELAFCAAPTPQAISPWAHRLFEIVTQVLGALVSPMGLIAAIGFSPSWASQESRRRERQGDAPFFSVVFG